jgi:hypothetical protein
MNYVNQRLSGLNGFDAENCRSAAATRRAKAHCQTRAMWTWAFGTARANVTRISRSAGNRRVGLCPEYFFFWPQPPPRQAVRTRRPPLLPLPISATSSPAGWMPQTAAPRERDTRTASRSARRKGRASGCESPALTAVNRRRERRRYGAGFFTCSSCARCRYSSARFSSRVRVILVNGSSALTLVNKPTCS